MNNNSSLPNNLPNPTINNPTPSGHKNKILVTISIIVIAFLVLWFWLIKLGKNNFQAIPTFTPRVNLEAQENVAIDQEVQAVDLGNLDDEFQSIDQDLNTL